MSKNTRQPDTGRLIVIEGIDGTGKSTVTATLSQRLTNAGFTVVASREPTMGPWGQKIRALYGGGREKIHADEELRWFLKDREMHVQEVVRPALTAGKTVVLDRYYHSTVAYQGARGHYSTGALERKNREIAPAPDLTVILDLEVRESLRRVRDEREDTANTFENEQYLHQVKTIYDAMHGPDIVHIDANVSREQLAEDVWQAVRRVLPGRFG